MRRTPTINTATVEANVASTRKRARLAPIVIQLTDGRERPASGPRGSWPTQIRASQVTSGPFEGVPRTNLSYAQLVVRSPHNVEHFLFVWFGRPHPTVQQLARANAELATVGK